MLRLFIFAVLVNLAVGKAPVKQLESKTRIPNEYIVAFEGNITDDAVVKHLKQVQTVLSHSNETRPTPKLLSEFNMQSFKGYAFRGPMSVVEKIQYMPEVEFIEANQVFKAVQADCIDQQGATWGLVRTVERDLFLDGIYTYDDNAAGEGVAAYVIDTGIYTQHNDFGGRATWGTDTVDDPSPETDENGHGTHVAGTIGGTTYGIAKKADLIAVKVLDRNGAGSTISVVNGVQWVENHHRGKQTSNAAGSVANMSLGGSFALAMNLAVVSAINSGVSFVVAAGNAYGADACDDSPASVEQAVTVGCSNDQDEFCVFSNAGQCVNILAPGEGITSAWINGPFSDNTISGTSMSSPHVAGVAAKYISSLTSTPTPRQVQNWLEDNATKEKITRVPTDTPNNLVFMECV
ncbi:uncharacterized protein [Ptychodera flava]|uniref:uncharacterized protein n=1 Tax=Ptychodera flava TaxID=63121 RepID=UPI00396A7613